MLSLKIVPRATRNSVLGFGPKTIEGDIPIHDSRQLVWFGEA
jgi:hypothetical protein